MNFLTESLSNLLKEQKEENKSKERVNSKLEKVLKESISKLDMRNIKSEMDKASFYERALKECLEGQFPDKHWTDITSCNIYSALINSNNDTDAVIRKILLESKIDRPRKAEVSKKTRKTLNEGESVVKKQGKKSLTESRNPLRIIKQAQEGKIDAEKLQNTIIDILIDNYLGDYEQWKEETEFNPIFVLRTLRDHVDTDVLKDCCEKAAAELNIDPSLMESFVRTGSKKSLKESSVETRYYNRDGLKPWRGCEEIKFKWNGTQSDPDLIYKGYTFNYWDIEDALWADFSADGDIPDSMADDPEVERNFNAYVCEFGPSYLDDYIANGAPKNWHSRYGESLKESDDQYYIGWAKTSFEEFKDWMKNEAPHYVIYSHDGKWFVAREVGDGYSQQIDDRMMPLIRNDEFLSSRIVESVKKSSKKKAAEKLGLDPKLTESLIKKLSSLKESKSLKESDEVYVFTQEPDDWYGVDFEDYEGDIVRENGIVIMGNRDFVPYGDEELIKIINGDYEDDDLWNEEDGYYEDYDVLDELKKVTGKDYGKSTIRGYTQSDWNDVYYPVDLEDWIDEVETFYFGKYDGFDGPDDTLYVVPHDISWKGTEAIKKELADQSGYPADKIKIRKFTGYTRTPSYEDESLKEGRHCKRPFRKGLKESKKKRAGLSTIVPQNAYNYKGFILGKTENGYKIRENDKKTNYKEIGTAKNLDAACDFVDNYINNNGKDESLKESGKKRTRFTYDDRVIIKPSKKTLDGLYNDREREECKSFAGKEGTITNVSWNPGYGRREKGFYLYTVKTDDGKKIDLGYADIKKVEQKEESICEDTVKQGKNKHISESYEVQFANSDDEVFSGDEFDSLEDAKEYAIDMFHTGPDYEYFVIYDDGGSIIFTDEDITESLTEDTVKQGSQWVNKGKEGTHGKFKTKKAADAQRKAMFANGYKEGLNEAHADLSDKTGTISHAIRMSADDWANAKTKEEAVSILTRAIKNECGDSPAVRGFLAKINNRPLYDIIKMATNYWMSGADLSMGRGKKNTDKNFHKRVNPITDSLKETIESEDDMIDGDYDWDGEYIKDTPNCKKVERFLNRIDVADYGYQLVRERPFDGVVEVEFPDMDTDIDQIDVDRIKKNAKEILGIDITTDIDDVGDGYKFLTFYFDMPSKD